MFALWVLVNILHTEDGLCFTLSTAVPVVVQVITGFTCHLLPVLGSTGFSRVSMNGNHSRIFPVPEPVFTTCCKSIFSDMSPKSGCL